MAEEVKKEIGQDFADYLKSKAKVEGNAATLTLSDLKGFYKSKGVTESMVDQWSGLQKEVETGLYRFANDKVLEQVKDLKKKGKTEEAKKVQFEVKLNISNGIQKFTVRALTINQNPQDRTKDVKKYGQFSEKIKTSRAIDKDVMEDYAARIEKELGLK